MSPAVEAALREIISTYGSSIWRERQRLEGLMRDFCPDERGAVSVLIAAVREGVVEDIARDPQVEQGRALRLARRLYDDAGVALDLGGEAVGAWTRALGGHVASPPPLVGLPPAPTAVHTSPAGNASARTLTKRAPPAGNVYEFSDGNFDAEVLKSDKPTLVDFWATWCAPCRAIAPVVEALAAQYKGQVKVGKLDVDHNQKVASTYGVRSIPTLLLFKGGKVVEQLVGAGPNTKAKLEEAFKKAT